jgi:Sec-independent protein translocase protein TatA
LESDSERPEVTAFLELEHLVRNVGEALAGFRRRAMAAETRLREMGESGDGARSNAELEREVNQLREKLDRATTRTEQMLERVRFLRQQQVRGE